jgi:hypothetical protein
MSVFYHLYSLIRPLSISNSFDHHITKFFNASLDQTCPETKSKCNFSFHLHQNVTEKLNLKPLCIQSSSISARTSNAENQFDPLTVHASHFRQVLARSQWAWSDGKCSDIWQITPGWILHQACDPSPIPIFLVIVDSEKIPKANVWVGYYSVSPHTFLHSMPFSNCR